MTERRNFLKAASILTLFGSAPGITAASFAQSEPTGQSNSTPPAKSSGDQAPLPKPPDVVEQQFHDYHLLGKPDPAANLIGSERPRDWQTTKLQVAQALNDVAHPRDPIHEWLRTFRLTFDDRTTSIVLAAAGTLRRSAAATELKYEPQLYDASLRSASALLDRCLRYRNEMGVFEVSGVGAGISYLSFLKMKPLQRNLLILSNSADLAEIEKVTQANAYHNYSKGHGLDKLFERVHLHGLQIESEGGEAEAGLTAAKDRLATHLLEKQFHIQTDAQLAQFTRLLSSGSSSNFAERYLRLLALLVEDLGDAYRKLYSASKGIQQVLGITQIVPGLGQPVNIDIPHFDNPGALKVWVQQMVPAQDGDQRKPDVVDALVIWTRAVMRELDARSQYETEFTISIPLNQPWGEKNAVILQPADIAAAFNPPSGSPSGTVSFNLATDVLPFSTPPTSIRVVGVGLTVEHSSDDASPPQYSASYHGTTPGSKDPEPNDTQKADVRTFESYKMGRLNANVVTPPQNVPGVGTYARPRLFLSNVRIQGGMGGDFEPNLTYDPGCRNLSPFGAWTIFIDPNVLEFFQSASRLPDSWITGLILHLRLRGTSI